MFEVGEANGNKVFFNPTQNLVYCKTLILDYHDLIEAYTCDFDRFNIRALKSVDVEERMLGEDSSVYNSSTEYLDITVRKTPMLIEIGCIKISTEVATQLIKTLKNYVKVESSTSES